jgi:molybdopterin molybdotransferase
MTGAPLPDGADAVVMVEHTRTEGGVVHVERTVGPGSAVRRPGEDVRVGDLVGSPGTELTPSRVALLASVGIDRVIAHRRPRVGVLATGDELVRSGGPLGPGQIRDSSSVLVRGLALESGADVVDLGMATDDEPSLHEAVLRGTDTCDVVVTTGGASVGDRDLLRVVIGELGVVHWLQVACKPAKPLVAGAVDGTPVLGLPGNPVSAMVAFELFARPTIRRLAGHTDLHRPLVEAVAPDGLARRRDGKVHYVRVVAEPDGNGRWSVRLAGGQRSHQLAALADANGLAVVPDGDGLAPGSSVPVMLLG